jgi:hypothetical protein
MTTKLSPYQINLLRTAITYFTDVKKDEIENDWIEGIHDDAIALCKRQIFDAVEVDALLKKMYQESFYWSDNE